MRFSVLLFAAMAACAAGFPFPAAADLIPPHMHEAQARLAAEPKIFDRTDNFCTGKRPGDACSIPGSAFAGGGAGICRNHVDRGSPNIDLSCIRTAQVSVDRQVPDGRVELDTSHCKTGTASGVCKPVERAPADQFCRTREAGSPCTADVKIDGQTERQEGVCRKSEERRFGSVYREVLLCQPAATTQRSYTKVDWRQKLTQ